MSLMVLLALIGLLILVSWPLLVRRRHQRPKRLNQPTIDRHPVPPTHPRAQARPGSAPYRHRQGKP